MKKELLNESKSTMNITNKDVKDISDYEPGEEVQCIISGKIINVYKGESGCDARVEIDKLEMSNDMKRKADRMGIDKKSLMKIEKSRSKGK